MREREREEERKREREGGGGRSERAKDRESNIKKWRRDDCIQLVFYQNNHTYDD